MQDLDKRARVSLLRDFYGPLLTPKQNEILELYYDDDLSLGEIAEQSGITRQAVHDLIKRAEKSLENYEKRLNLASRFEEQRVRLRRAYSLLSDLTDDFDQVKAAEVLGILRDVLETEM